MVEGLQPAASRSSPTLTGSEERTSGPRCGILFVFFGLVYHPYSIGEKFDVLPRYFIFYFTKSAWKVFLELWVREEKNKIVQELLPVLEGAEVDARAAVFSMTPDGYPLVSFQTLIVLKSDDGVKSACEHLHR